MNSVKRNINFKKLILYPILFGLLSLFTSYIFSLFLAKVIFSIPHYESTKGGTGGVLLSMILGIPFGITYYLATLKLKSIKHRLIGLVSVLFITLSVINVYELVDTSCSMLQEKKKWNDRELKEDRGKFERWSKICQQF